MDHSIPSSDYDRNSSNIRRNSPVSYRPPAAMEGIRGEQSKYHFFLAAKKGGLYLGSAAVTTLCFAILLSQGPKLISSMNRYIPSVSGLLSATVITSVSSLGAFYLAKRINENTENEWAGRIAGTLTIFVATAALTSTLSRFVLNHKMSYKIAALYGLLPAGFFASGDGLLPAGFFASGADRDKLEESTIKFMKDRLLGFPVITCIAFAVVKVAQPLFRRIPMLWGVVTAGGVAGVSMLLSYKAIVKLGGNEEENSLLTIAIMASVVFAGTAAITSKLSSFSPHRVSYLGAALYGVIGAASLFGLGCFYGIKANDPLIVGLGTAAIPGVLITTAIFLRYGIPTTLRVTGRAIAGTARRVWSGKALVITTALTSMGISYFYDKDNPLYTVGALVAIFAATAFVAYKLSGERLLSAAAYGTIAAISGTVGLHLSKDPDIDDKYRVVATIGLSLAAGAVAGTVAGIVRLCLPVVPFAWRVTVETVYKLFATLPLTLSSGLVGATAFTVAHLSRKTRTYYDEFDPEFDRDLLKRIATVFLTTFLIAPLLVNTLTRYHVRMLNAALFTATVLSSFYANQVVDQAASRADEDEEEDDQSDESDNIPERTIMGMAEKRSLLERLPKGVPRYGGRVNPASNTEIHIGEEYTEKHEGMFRSHGFGSAQREETDLNRYGESNV